MKRKYFGTDGMRGEAGRFPLDLPTVYAMGRAAGKVLGKGSAPTLVGMDPRKSSDWISEALMDGLEREGVQCVFAGVIPTPGVAWLLSRGEYAFGVVISASHNPYTDNGVKFFSGEGFKLSDEVEERVEYELEGCLGETPALDLSSRAPENSCLLEYVEGLSSLWRGQRLEGKRIAVDCSNGAAYRAAPMLFERLGAEVEAMSCSPDGENINRNCGSLYPKALAKRVRESGADMGFAFDGDADRCMAVTASGKILDGDYLLYWEAGRLAKKANGGPGCVVGTLMSNLWLEKALREKGIAFYRSSVGDRYVLKELRERGGTLGGEPSGHLLFLDRATTGDGLLTAMNYAMLAREGGGLDAMRRGINPFPQTIVNIPVAKKTPFSDCPVLAVRLEEEERHLAGNGRIVLRYSGTEPVVRLMVEADSHETVEGVIERLRPVLEDELGR